jgi:hypothetical protein
MLKKRRPVIPAFLVGETEACRHILGKSLEYYLPIFEI